MFCHGFCSDACLGFETKEIRHVVDGGESLVHLQVPYILWERLMSSFAALQGPLPYAKHLISPSRLPFTIAFFGSMGLTLFFSVGVHPLTAGRLMIVTFYDIDFVICDCPDCGFSELLCVLCPWRDSRITLWRKDCA